MNITADSGDGTRRRIGPDVCLQIGVAYIYAFVDYANDNFAAAGGSVPGLWCSDLVQSV